MGCDGGTIPKRSELIRTKKKPEQKDKDSELSYRWRHCSITQQPLQKPIVACSLGRLYSKTSVIEALLDRSNLPETACHIKSLKDIKELNLTPNPTFQDGAEKGGVYIDTQSAPFICPVIGLEMNGKFKFSFVWGCGCVMSERALKEIKTTFCHKCQKPFLEEDIVILNAVDEDLNLMTTRMEARQARIKLDRKNKKALVQQKMVEESCSVVKIEDLQTDAVKTESCDKPSSVNTKLDSCEKPSSTKTEVVTAVVKTEACEGPSSTNTKLVMKTKKTIKAEKRPYSKIVNPDFKKAKSSYSVSKDPNATEVFKSLFTTHQNAKDQTKAHWITYNPFYN